jgi:hypothetical protein
MSTATNEAIGVKKEYLGLLGENYQVKLLGELMIPNNINIDTGNIFFDEVIDYLQPNYFEKLDMRRLMALIKEYYQMAKNPPNIDNIFSLIQTKITNNIEKIELEARLKQIQEIWISYKNNSISNDRSYIKKNTILFIKQQEILKVSTEAQEKFNSGIIDEHVIYSISEKYKKINDIGSPEHFGTTLFEKVDELLIDDYRDPIGLGIKEVDEEIDGGISKGEWALVLAGQGVGKTSVLTLIANNAYLKGQNVCHIILEGKKNDIRRRHYAKLFNIRTKDLSKRKDYVHKCVEKLKNSKTVGNLIIEKLTNMTPSKLRKWVLKTEEKLGYKFDVIVLDYLDCLKSDEKVQDRFYAQELIAQDMERIVDEEQWRLYAGIQAKKEANTKKILSIDDIYGSAERGKKAQLVVSLGKSIEQANNNQLNICIAKCRFARSGKVWENSSFDADLLKFDVNIQDIKILTPEEGKTDDIPLVTNNNSNLSQQAINSKLLLNTIPA